MGKSAPPRTRLPARAPERVPVELSPVPASGWTDYREVEVDFDAAGWFEEATDTQITELAACGWSHDYPADAVLEWATDHYEDAERLWEYIHGPKRHRMPFSNDPVGFECAVDGAAAMRLLARIRPDLHARLVASGIDPLTGEKGRS